MQDKNARLHFCLAFFAQMRYNTCDGEGCQHMRSSLIALMAEKEIHFSKGQRRIARFITDHYEEAAFMTALRLGEEVGVSESTVVRFAAELGFDGYPQLQKAMQELIRSKLTVIQRLEVTRARMTDDEVLPMVATGDINNIRQTIEGLDKNAFFQAVETVIHARQVYIFGAGSCKMLAGFLNHYLQMLMGGRVHLISTSSQNEIFEELLDVTQDDAVIGISFPRYSSKTAKTMHYARSKNAAVVAITDSILSPMAPFATTLLLAHSDMASVVDSLVAPLSIINALIVAVSLKTMEQSRSKLEELEKLWNTYQVYENVDEAGNTGS